MDENTIRKEVTEDLRKQFAQNRYTDAERLAAFEILLTKIQQMLMKSPDKTAQEIIDMIDEEMDK